MERKILSLRNKFSFTRDFWLVLPIIRLNRSSMVANANRLKIQALTVLHHQLSMLTSSSCSRGETLYYSRVSSRPINANSHRAGNPYDIVAADSSTFCPLTTHWNTPSPLSTTKFWSNILLKVIFLLKLHYNRRHWYPSAVIRRWGSDICHLLLDLSNLSMECTKFHSTEGSTFIPPCNTKAPTRLRKLPTHQPQIHGL